MEKTAALAALSALAQESRLDVFRLLVQAGAGGMPAGQIARTIDTARSHPLFPPEPSEAVRAC